MIPVLLLFASNVFMNLAWYGHLKWFPKQGETRWPLIMLPVLASWSLAFFEYCLQVPANRMGYEQGYSAYQLKIFQEAISISVFMLIAWTLFGEGLKWNYLVAFALILAGVCFAVIPANSQKI